MTALLIGVSVVSFLAGVWLIAKANVEHKRTVRRHLVLMRLYLECGR